MLKKKINGQNKVQSIKMDLYMHPRGEIAMAKDNNQCGVGVAYITLILAVSIVLILKIDTTVPKFVLSGNGSSERKSVIFFSVETGCSAIFSVFIVLLAKIASTSECVCGKLHCPATYLIV